MRMCNMLCLPVHAVRACTHLVEEEERGEEARGQQCEEAVRPRQREHVDHQGAAAGGGEAARHREAREGAQAGDGRQQRERGDAEDDRRWAKVSAYTEETALRATRQDLLELACAAADPDAAK